mmetsp:Transcript_2225/g.5168  ORF Transcript_2225/g.5168 Transcript_2225/m.5168 type:complete len:84 (+) Transcript_2225:816-1067(+)
MGGFLLRLSGLLTDAFASLFEQLSGDVISSQFAALEAGDTLEDELDALKGKTLGTTQVRGQLPGNAEYSETIEAELRELKENE